jgi:hypothetical protein
VTIFRGMETERAVNLGTGPALWSLQFHPRPPFLNWTNLGLSLRRGEPLSLPFSTERIQPKPGGQANRFYDFSSFVCAVQLAARGDEANAQAIWRRFVLADYWSGGGWCQESMEEPEDLRLFFGNRIFDHLRQRILQGANGWPEVHGRMKALFDECPALRTKERKELFDDLTATLKARPPKPGSTEALLLAWAGQPNCPEFNSYGVEFETTNSPAREVVRRRYTAVPDLIALLNDRRLVAREFCTVNTPDRIARVSDVAQDFLREITALSTTNRDAFQTWWKKNRRRSEPEILADSVFHRSGGQITWVNRKSVELLASNYPALLPDLCDEFCKAASPRTSPASLPFALAASPLPTDVRLQTLSDLAQKGPWEHQQAFLGALGTIDEKKAAEIILPILRKLPATATGNYSDCPEVSAAGIVFYMENDAPWREYLRTAQRSQPGLRLEMINAMTRYGLDERHRGRCLAFLAVFLEDKAAEELDRSTGLGRVWAGWQAPKISVRDFAAMQVARLLEWEEDPDESWTPAQWDELHKKVRAKLAAEKLPDLTTPR